MHEIWLENDLSGRSSLSSWSLGRHWRRHCPLFLSPSLILLLSLSVSLWTPIPPPTMVEPSNQRTNPPLLKRNPLTRCLERERERETAPRRLFSPYVVAGGRPRRLDTAAGGLAQPVCENSRNLLCENIAMVSQFEAPKVRNLAHYWVRL